MTKQTQLDIWIEDENGRLSGEAASQLVHDIYRGLRDPADYRVLVSEGIGTHK